MTAFRALVLCALLAIALVAASPAEAAKPACHPRDTTCGDEPQEPTSADDDGTENIDVEWVRMTVYRIVQNLPP